METHKITLMEAYMIETLRTNGISNETLVAQLEQKDLSPFEAIHDKYDFNELIKLYDEDYNLFNSILVDGYKVKFVTMNGLRNLLKLKFDKIEEQDYQLTDKGIVHMKIEEEVIPAVRQLLSSNWTIEEHTLEDSSQSGKEISILLT